MTGSGATDGARRRRPSCKLVPPCKQGGHGPYINSKGENAVRPIGKYYFSEDALKHDLAALKQGDIYGWDEFYKRAKAWYKGEVDRLLHLEKVREELEKSPTNTIIITTNPTLKPAEPIGEALATNTRPQTPTTSRKDAETPPAKAPTRIQPARAAKRKAADPPPTKPPPRRKPRAQAPAFPPAPGPIQAQTQAQHTRSAAADETTATTGGEYTLAAFDWAQFLNGNKGEHRPGPWSYVQLQGLDVAYFGMRLEKAVGDKIGEIIARDYRPPRSGSLGAMGQLTGIGFGPHDNVRGNEKSTKNGIVAEAPLEQCQQLQIQIHPPPKFRCALQGHPTHSSSNKPAVVFQPAAALAPGEDWRPPMIAGLQPAGKNSLNPKIAKSKITQDTTTGAHTAPKNSSSCWAADEVSRREETKRRAVAAAGPAPEAVMEISPTLGRWRRHSLGTGGGELPVEDLGANVIEVAGLRFAVDLCATSTFGGGGGGAGGAGAGNRGLGAKAVEEGARFLML